MLARAAKDEDSLELKVLTPFINGWTNKRDTSVHKAVEDELMLRPALIIAWEECVADRQAFLDAQNPVTLPSSASTQNSQGNPLFPPAPPAPAKLPKELLPGQ